MVMPDLTTDPQYSTCGLYCVSRQGSGSAPRSVMSLPRVFRPSALKSLAASFLSAQAAEKPCQAPITS